MGIAIPGTDLPIAGNAYKLTWGANVRSAPPGKKRADGTNLAENVGYLGIGREIQVTTVKNSGNTGHIWLEIAY